MTKKLEGRVRKLRKSIRRLAKVLASFSNKASFDTSDDQSIMRFYRDELGKKATTVRSLPEDYCEIELELIEHIAKVLSANSLQDPQDHEKDVDPSDIKSKAEIRNLLRGMPYWELQKQKKAERKKKRISSKKRILAKEYLSSLGIQKVRIQGKKITVQTNKKEIIKILKKMGRFQKKMKLLGFCEVAFSLSF